MYTTVSKFLVLSRFSSNKIRFCTKLAFDGNAFAEPDRKVIDTPGSVEARKELLKFYPKIVAEIRNEKEYDVFPEVFHRLEEMTNYMAAQGRKFRPIRILVDYKRMADPEDLTPQNLERSAVLGWILDFFYSNILIIDDIVDQGKFRRGLPAWHTKPGAYLQAINDVMMMEGFCYKLLKKYFQSNCSYDTLLHILHNLNFKTYMGQCLDCQYLNPVTKEVNFDKFTMDMYGWLSKYKAGQCTTISTLELTLALAKKYDDTKIEETLKPVLPILIQLAVVAQLYNDLEDLGKDPASNQTDISQGKLTWVVVKALELANQEQKDIIYRHYGKNNPDSAMAVFEVYEQLRVPLKSAVKDYLDTSFHWIRSEIRNSTSSIPKEVLYDYAQGYFNTKVDEGENSNCNE